MISAYHRPTRITVSLPNILHNYQLLKGLRQRPVFAVIKADAYGHGSLPIAKALEAIEADGFCVAVSDEALELRQAGITSRILVLGLTEPQDACLHAQKNIDLTVSSLDWLKKAYDFLKNSSSLPLNVHLKIDSGMGRIGVRDTKEAQAIIDFIKDHQDHLTLAGIFTHYATADSSQANCKNYVENQSQFFKEKIDALHLEVLTHRPIIHQSNTALSFWYPEKTLDAIRLGIGLYGCNPSDGEVTLPSDLPILPALSLTTTLSYVKQLPAGQSISYGATYTTEKDEWIGTLPIGYADGLPRSSTGYQVLIDGHLCPIVGRVCMDQCMVRLPYAMPTGALVTIIGTDPISGQYLSAESLAQYNHTISYELFCGFSPRIPRHYLN